MRNVYVVFFNQKTAYEIPKRDWSSDVCSSDLPCAGSRARTRCMRSAASPKLRRACRNRSEERRVGKEGRTRWSPDHLKKKKAPVLLHALDTAARLLIVAVVAPSRER